MKTSDSRYRPPEILLSRGLNPFQAFQHLLHPGHV